MVSPPPFACAVLAAASAGDSRPALVLIVRDESAAAELVHALAVPEQVETAAELAVAVRAETDVAPSAAARVRALVAALDVVVAAASVVEMTAWWGTCAAALHPWCLEMLTAMMTNRPGLVGQELNFVR
jgi:hypothetical protein